MEGSFLFLGTGASMGVPVIGCNCEVCLSPSPFNKRLRSASLIEIGDKKILLDIGPDFRVQALKFNISSIDALIVTHSHNDHISGLDDLRALFRKTTHSIPLYLSKETLLSLTQKFDYIFINPENNPTLLPSFDIHLLEKDRGDIEIVGNMIKYFTYEQSDMTVNGFRFGNLAYLSDIKNYPESIFEDIQGIETLIISSLRLTPSFLHFSVDEAIAFSRKAHAKKTYLTHTAHELDYDKTESYLPEDIRLAYDGLKVPFSISENK